MENNCKFTEDYKVIHAHIDHRTNNYTNLKGKVKDLQEVVHLQRAIIDSCHNQTAALEETMAKSVELVQTLERLVCHCQDWLLLPGPHFTEGENQEVVEDSKEDEEEDSLEYETEEPSDPSYTTPPNTRGHSFPSTYCPSCSPTPEGLDPENNTCLQTELIEAQVEAFLVEAKEDLN